MPNDSVLVVEDTPVNLKVVKILLSRHGFDVRTAATAEEALEVLRQFRPEVILTDVQLPGMSGLDLTRKLKSDPATRDILVLALTAFAMRGDEKRAYEAGCDGYITKPIDTRTFPTLVRQYLERNQGTRGPMLAETAEPADLAPSLREIRREFVADGLEQSGRLMGMLGAGFDPAEALVTAHRWTGSAGSVGYPEITETARELEAVLQQNGSGSTEHARELLERLARMFAAAREAGERPSGATPEPKADPWENLQQRARKLEEQSPQKESAEVALGLLAARQETPSPAVLSALSGKRFALAGFQAKDATRLAKALDACQAFSRDLGADVLPDAETVRPFDVVVLNIAAEVRSIPAWSKPVLIIGPREVLVGLQPVHSGAEDFLFTPWTTEEVILRAYFAISRAGQGRSPAAAPAAGGKRRVVVADDDSTIRALVEAAVGNAGFECRVATDGGAALETIRSWQPDMAVLDVNMPSRSGFEVLSALRGDPLTREIRVILLTARQQETDVIRGFGLGADDYVIKPFSPMELVARMKRLLGKSA
jgi:two-component system cell cycle response regulator DivK